MRFPSNDFLGNVSNPRVVEGNSLGLLSALLYFLAWVSLSCPVLEQPLNSCLPETPAWKYLLRWTKGHLHYNILGKFWGPLSKTVAAMAQQDGVCSFEPTTSNLAGSSC